MSRDQASLARQRCCLSKGLSSFMEEDRKCGSCLRGQVPVLHSQCTQKWKITAQTLYFFKASCFPHSFSRAIHWLLCCVPSGASPPKLTVKTYFSFFSVCSSPCLPLQLFRGQVLQGKKFWENLNCLQFVIIDLVERYWFQWTFSQIPYTYITCMHAKLAYFLLCLFETSDIN